MTYTIKQNVSLHTIASIFEDMGRKDQFSLYGLEAIMDYLEEVAVNDSAGHCKAIDLDVIAICCDFTESSIEDLLRDYPSIIEELDEDYAEDSEDFNDILRILDDYTWAVALDNGNILYINF